MTSRVSMWFLSASVKDKSVISKWLINCSTYELPRVGEELMFIMPHHSCGWECLKTGFANEKTIAYGILSCKICFGLYLAFSMHIVVSKFELW